MEYDDRYEECLQEVIDKVRTLCLPDFVETMSDKHSISWRTILDEMLITEIDCVVGDKLFDKE